MMVLIFISVLREEEFAIPYLILFYRELRVVSAKPIQVNTKSTAFYREILYARSSTSSCKSTRRW